MFHSDTVKSIIFLYFLFYPIIACLFTFYSCVPLPSVCITSAFAFGPSSPVKFCFFAVSLEAVPAFPRRAHSNIRATEMWDWFPGSSLHLLSKGSLPPASCPLCQRRDPRAHSVDGSDDGRAESQHRRPVGDRWGALEAEGLAGAQRPRAGPCPLSFQPPV